MNTRTYYETQLLNYMRNIPDDVLPEFIKIFDSMKNIVSSKNFNTKEFNKKTILDFAGSWNDFDDFDSFVDDIYKRRSKYFSKRGER